MKKTLLLFVLLCIPVIILAQGAYNDYVQDAKMGDAASQNELGCCYFKGLGVTKDFSKAVFWFKKAAEQGHAPAQCNLAYCYGNGLGVSKDYTQSVFWYKKSAEQGHAPAQCNLAYCYENGWGVTKDYALAFSWYKKAAEQGNVAAQSNLGYCHQNGWGVTKDYVQAIFWYKKSAEHGNAFSQNQLGWCYQNGLGVTKDYSQAVSWYKKSAEQGHASAQCNLAYCYENGWGVTKDYALAFSWYKKSAEQGYAGGQNGLGHAYHDGIGTPQDYDKAFYWTKKAAEQGGADAQYNLGLHYSSGEGVDKDDTQAVLWLKKSAEQNFNLAQLKLGTHYLYGVGVDADLKQAEYWISKAAENGNEEAKASLQMVKYRLRNQSGKSLQNSSFTSVDINIPSTGKENNKLFAVIIGNEKYQNEVEVPYAENDAKIFMEYLKQTIGVPEKQIKYVPNATLNGLRMAVKWLSQAMEVSGGKGQAYFYFAGHGIPDETNKNPYILPIDGMSSDPESAYSLEKLYSELNKMSAQRITVFLDACFSGVTREGKMMASARGVAIKAKPAALQGNMIVFSAAQGDEASYSLKEQQHGMFTYYLLKKLQETRGDITLGDLADYLQNEVKRQSFADNNKVQTPLVTVSQSIGDAWKSMKLK